MDKKEIGRLVRVVSIGFCNRSMEEILEVLDCEGKKGADIIVLPEAWRGLNSEPETVTGITVSAVAEMAKKHSTYIVCPIYRKEESVGRVNSSVLLNREGKVVSVYDKVFPYWEEFDLNPPAETGNKVTVYDADFGRIGVAVCFDANFPEVWKELADLGAELVIWPSAYSAGTTLQAHALNNHYYIVTSTLMSDCTVWDITGQELLYEKSDGINISRIVLDLDRGIYHENFNMEKKDKLLAEHGDSIMQEMHLEREQWFVLKAVQSGVSARELAKEYGMEELRDYINRSRTEINKKRR